MSIKSDDQPLALKRKAAKKNRFPVLPLRDLVVFPKVIDTLFIGRKRSASALEYAIEHDTPLFLVAQKNSASEAPEQEDLYETGVVARLVQTLNLPDGTVKVLIEGMYRAQVKNFESYGGCHLVACHALTEEESKTGVKGAEAEAMIRALNAEVEAYIDCEGVINVEILKQLKSIQTPGVYADLVACHLQVNVEFKQKILACVDERERVDQVLALLKHEIEWAEQEKALQDRVKKKITEEQRAYYMRVRMEEMKDQLGKMQQGEGAGAEVDYDAKIKALGLPQETLEKVESELNKLKQMPPMSQEATVLRHWLDWVMDLPWSQKDKLSESLSKAKRTLDEDHFGLEKVKDRVLESIAVQMRVKKVSGTILCLVGPPGVGKTSLGASIARAMGRSFVRIALGGVRDEAEIRGHRKTYIGAMPGRILKAMKKAKVQNPLILLDEVDKIGSDFRGDPSSALLEVLDPEQNHTFYDHYLEVEYDLSNVFFLATANDLSEIPLPLLDRMEIIQLSGYTESEKLHIAKKYLLPKHMARSGLGEQEITFGEKSMRQVVQHYTREAGVRLLEQNIAKICRCVVKEQMMAKKDVVKKSTTVTLKRIADFLGVMQYTHGIVQGKNRVGYVRGLAWTSVGGELLTIEARAFPGKGELQHTGSLGDVMQESIQAAVSVVRAATGSLELKKNYLQDHDLHVHVPEGATPKDGPSAGIAMCTAIISSIHSLPVFADVAMTGEVTLHGEVLAIGGLKEKLLAAIRGGIKQVIIPEENRKDLVELPDEVHKTLTIHCVRHVNEVYPLALDIGHESVRAARPKAVSKKAEATA
jgi:ATP-dependent Lon protease